VPSAVTIQSATKVITPVCDSSLLDVPQHPCDILIAGIISSEKPAQTVLAQVLPERIVLVKAFGLALKSWASAALRTLKFDVDAPPSFSEAAKSVHRWVVCDVHVDHPARCIRALLS
jgi:hypothetical protein